MKDIIFLAHRIPYPPNKGDKIRSYHLLKGLAQHYRVHLGTFIDDPHDWQYREKLAPLCQETCYIGINPRTTRVRSLRGLLTGKPLTCTYYRSRRLARWVRSLLAGGQISGVLACSSAMGQYVSASPQLRRVLDFVDVDSDKWRQYATAASWPMNWLYQREFKRLLATEIRLARTFDAVVFVSEAEAALFRRLAPRAHARISGIGNGVDTDYFDPDLDYPDPYPNPEAPVIVFTGAMDYRANVDAVTWFVTEVWPAVRQRCRKAEFWIVGSRPSAEVRELDGKNGVHVTGRVADVRPYLRYARVAAAPLRIARGLQNKVLEALAMNVPVVATPQAWEGIRSLPEGCGWSVADAREMAASIGRHSLGEVGAGSAGRRFIMQHYDWSRTLAGFRAALEPEPVPGPVLEMQGSQP